MAKTAAFVYQRSSTEGTADIELVPAAGFRTFAEAFPTNSGADPFFYCIRDKATGEYENGQGYLNVDGALVRATVYEGSNGTSQVDFGAGLKDVTCDVPAVFQEKIPNVDQAFTSAEKTKLSGIATNATQNAADAYLLDRANHTGTQSMTTVSGLQTALDDKPSSAQVQVQIDNSLENAPASAEQLAAIAAGKAYDINKAADIVEHWDFTSQSFLTMGTGTKVVNAIGQAKGLVIAQSGADSRKPDWVAPAGADLGCLNFTADQFLSMAKSILYHNPHFELFAVLSGAPQDFGAAVGEGVTQTGGQVGFIMSGSGSTNNRLVPFISSNRVSSFGQPIGPLELYNNVKKLVRLTNHRGVLTAFVDENMSYGGRAYVQGLVGATNFAVGGLLGSNGNIAYGGAFKMWDLVVLSSDKEANEVAGELLWKHGLQANAPATFPYKTVRPNAYDRIRFNPSPNTIRTAVIGDSLYGFSKITGGGATYGLNNRNFFNFYNFLSQNRMQMPATNVLAVPGEQTGSMRDRFVADFTPLNFETLFMLAGTNDGGTSWNDIRGNLKIMMDYATDILRKNVVIQTVIPQTGRTDANKSGYKKLNDWIMSLHGTKQGRVAAVDIASPLSDANDEPIANAYWDSTHEAPYGGFKGGKATYDVLKPLYGDLLKDFNADNLLLNGNMEGTGGTASAPVTGTVADSWTITGSGSALAGRVASKTGKRYQRLSMNVSGGNASEVMELSQAIAEANIWGNGLTVYLAALIEVIGNPISIKGLELIMKLTGTGLQTLTTVVGADGTNYPIAEVYQNPILPIGQYMITTDDMPITAGTSRTLTGRLRLTGDATVNAQAVVDVKGMGIYPR